MPFHKWVPGSSQWKSNLVHPSLAIFYFSLVTTTLVASPILYFSLVTTTLVASPWYLSQLSVLKSPWTRFPLIYSFIRQCIDYGLFTIVGIFDFINQNLSRYHKSLFLCSMMSLRKSLILPPAIPHLGTNWGLHALITRQSCRPHKKKDVTNAIYKPTGFWLVGTLQLQYWCGAKDQA